MTLSDTLGTFWLWYRTQMLSLMPARWKRRAGRGDFVLLVPAEDTDSLTPATADEEPVGTVLTATCWQDGQPRTTDRVEVDAQGAAKLVQLARRGRRSVPVLIGINAHDMLEKELRLPLGAQHALSSVVTFELPRLTPFAESALFWSCTVVRRILPHHRLVVRLRCTPRRPLAGLVSWLSRHGVAARELVVPDPRSAPNTWPAISITEHVPSRRRSLPALAACGIVIAIGAGLMVRQTLRLHALDARIDALHPVTQHAQSLRARYEILTGNPAILARQAQQTGSVVAALEALSIALPDSASLSELALQGRQFEVTGRAPSAAALLEHIARDSRFQDPSLAGAVTRSDDAKDDVFTIRARFIGDLAPSSASPAGRAP